MSSRLRPTWFGQCPECGATFDGPTRKAIDAAVRFHNAATRHGAGWAAVCGGCDARFGPGSRAAVDRQLREHQSEHAGEQLALTADEQEAVTA